MDYKKLELSINEKSEELKWDMKSRVEKLEELTSKYPEIIRAREIVMNISWILNVWTDDVKVDEAFSNLDVLLKQKNDGD